MSRQVHVLREPPARVRARVAPGRFQPGRPGLCRRFAYAFGRRFSRVPALRPVQRIDPRGGPAVHCRDPNEGRLARQTRHVEPGARHGLQLAQPVLLAALALGSGCSYHYRVAAGGPAGANPSAFPQSKVLHSFFWGLVQDRSLIGVCEEDGALSSVRASTNLGFAIVTVASLGIWAPARVEYRCVNRTPGGGTIYGAIGAVDAIDPIEPGDGR